MCIFSHCCLTAACQCPAFDFGKKTAFTWKLLSNVEFMALGPAYPTAPVSTLNLQIKVTAQEQRARCQCCLHCVWDLRVSYPHRA